jgi:hypothetical protein
MSTKYPGGIIVSNPVAPTPSSASGIWTLEQQEQAQQAGIWPFGGPFNYIEDVFSTWLYTGSTGGGTQNIVNNIDLATKGGLTWIKCRNAGYTHFLNDTVRGAGNVLQSNTTSANQATTPTFGLTSFNADGFTVKDDGTGPGGALAGQGGGLNFTGNTYVSWTFREQPKFFDVVTWSGDSTSGRQIAHNLGSTPGMVIIKSLVTDNWCVWHRSLTAGNYIVLNSTAAQTTAGAINRYGNGTTTVDPTSAYITVGSNGEVNQTGNNYVAYIFAHDAGGFGLTGSDNVISCGSFTASSGAATVTLGYEPQWIMFKRSDSATGGNWYMVDTMRGWSFSKVAELSANTSNAEDPNAFVANPTATGFSFGTGTLSASGTYIYIAIRRGPMKVPTDATKVFSPVARSGTSAAATVTAPNFVVDSAWIQSRQSGWQASKIFDRLRGANRLVYSNTTAAEVSVADTTLNSFASNVGFSLGNDENGYSVNTSGQTYINYTFQRAPSFFDEVCDTGTGVGRTINHNLGVVPQLMIRKRRNSTSNWCVYPNDITQVLFLDATNAFGTNGATYWNSTTPTSTVFSIGTNTDVNITGGTYVTYLFATCPGVSKVGTYTGTGATQTIACGFTAGARFVLIKRTDSTGDWYVWDSARGIIPANDPYLLLNSTAAEVTGTDYVDTTAVGFDITSTAPAAINASGGTFIFLAIA